MNATNESNSKELASKAEDSIQKSLPKQEIFSALGKASSIRPQKSMMRIKSLKPTRMKMSRRATAKKIVIK